MFCRDSPKLHSFLQGSLLGEIMSIRILSLFHHGPPPFSFDILHWFITVFWHVYLFCVTFWEAWAIKFIYLRTGDSWPSVYNRDRFFSTTDLANQFCHFFHLLLM